MHLCWQEGQGKVWKEVPRILLYAQTWCYNGAKLDTKKHKEIFKDIYHYPYYKVVFNGFLFDRLDMDYSFEA